MPKILIVEDDDLVAETILDALQSEHHVAEWIKDGTEGFERLSNYHYDLAILDWVIPGLTGPEICGRYRANGGSIPILMLTGKSAEIEKVHGLDSGADDY